MSQGIPASQIETKLRQRAAEYPHSVDLLNNRAELRVSVAAK
jgi:hypothetical protein